MREILFRGKRVDYGNWVYGCLLNNIYGASKPIIVNNAEYTDDNRIGFDFEFIDQSTIGQYTGLTDKNGKKIFEGDIVKFCDNGAFCGDTGIIVYNENNAKFLYQPLSILVGYSIDNTCTYEVIGNIHDDPELLGGV